MAPEIDMLLGLSVYSRLERRENGRSFRIFCFSNGYMIDDLQGSGPPFVVKGVKNDGAPES